MPTDQSHKATGVLLQNGQEIQAQQEVVLCAGAIGSPMVLMASGIGPKSLLSERQIPVLHDLRGVGVNMIDHFALFQVFKLCPSEKGLAFGHSDLRDPAFLLGMPTNYVVNEGLPRDILEKSLDEDGISGTERQALLQPGRRFLELSIFIIPLAQLYLRMVATWRRPLCLHSQAHAAMSVPRWLTGALPSLSLATSGPR